MKLVCAAMCFIFVFVSFLADAHSEPLVRVRLLEVPNKIEISGTGLRFQNLGESYRSVAIPQKAQAEVRLMEKDGKNLWALRVNNKDPEQLFPQKFLFIQGENLRLGAKAIPSRVILNINANKGVDVVGVVPLDDYVVGVLASEMPLSWPMETLKAQAVAARSYALSVMNERKEKAYHLESSILDQVYRHVLDHNENDPLIRKAVQAVKATEGLELYGSDQKVLKAFFHSDCGGETTSAKNVWNSNQSSGVTIDKSCPFNPKAHWKLTLSKEEMEKRLGVKDLAEVNLLRLPAEKRVKTVRLAMNDHSTKEFSSNDFRQALGFQELRSSLFNVKRLGSAFVFEGQGFGHGVGLCQWGSRALGKNGLSFKQILKHYYPLATLK